MDTKKTYIFEASDKYLIIKKLPRLSKEGSTTSTSSFKNYYHILLANNQYTI